METFADYLLGEQDLINKMDILNKLQRMLREKRGISIFFNNTVIFKAEIARMFLTDYLRGICSFDYLEEINTINVEYLNQVLKDVFNEKNMILSVVKN